MNIKPNRIFPEKVYALMWGHTLRREFSDKGGNYWEPLDEPGLFIYWGVPAVNWIEQRPTVFTHLQKKMRFGIFMTTGPNSWGFHFWFHWHMQEFPDPADPDKYIPNSEDGIYFRLPGHRWDLEEGMIKTGGRVPGAHWD